MYPDSAGAENQHPLNAAAFFGANGASNRRDAAASPALGRQKPYASNSLVSAVFAWILLSSLHGVADGSYTGNPGSDLSSILRPLGQHFGDGGACVVDVTADFMSTVVDAMTKPHHALQLENMIPCNYLPLQRTPLPNTNKVSEFSYFAPFDFILNVVQWLFDIVGCFLPGFDVDTDAIMEALVPLLDTEGAFNLGETSNSFLDFTPIPYKEGFEEMSDCQNEPQGACGEAMPCCHLQNEEGEVWYGNCLTQSLEPFCQTIDTATTNATCTAEGFNCTNNVQCCQYNEGTDNVHLCDKNVVDGVFAETGVCRPQPEQPYGWNPICIAWNYLGGGDNLDTIAFAFPQGVPPLLLGPDPFESLPGRVFPNKGLVKKLLGPSSSKLCQLDHGIEVARLPSGVVKLFKLYGMGGSSANRLEFGSNTWTRGTEYGDSVPAVWDGFLSIPLPPRPGVDFWMAFRLEHYPIPLWESKKTKCALSTETKPDEGSLKQRIAARFAEQLSEVALQLTFELYVDGGGGSSGPCVIVTMPSAVIKFSFFRFIIGRGIGGWCKNDTPNPCTPSGFFLNIEPTFEAKTFATQVPLGLILSGLEEADNKMDEEETATDFDISEPLDLGGGASFGVFVDDDTDDVKSIAFRYESLQIRIFGIQVLRKTGGIHFQWLKGSELERRRKSILKFDGEPVCPDTVANCEVWKNYQIIDPTSGTDAYGGTAEICETHLLELDPYNIALIAMTDNRMLPKRIDSSDTPDTWYGNPKFHLQNYPDSSLVIVYAKMSMWVLPPLISLDSLSFTIIVNTISMDDLGLSLGENGEYVIDDPALADEDIAGYEAALEEKSKGSNKQNVYVELEMEISVLFLINFQAAAALYNNADGLETFEEWVLEGYLEVDSPIMTKPFAIIDFKSRPFTWNELDRRLNENSSSADRLLSSNSSPEPAMDIFLEFNFNLGQAIIGALEVVWDAIENVANKIVEALEDVAKEIEHFFSRLGPAVIRLFNRSFNSVPGACKSGPESCFNALGSGIEAFGKGLFDGLVDLGRGLNLDQHFGPGGFMDDAWQATAEFVGDALQAVDDFFTGGGPYWQYENEESLEFTNVAECISGCSTTPCPYCHDDLLCPVKVRRRRSCTKKSFCFKDCTECGNWVPYTEKRNLECREDVAKSCADLEELRAKIAHLESVLDENDTEHVRGLKDAIVDHPEDYDFAGIAVEIRKFQVASGNQKKTMGLGMHPVSDVPVLQPDNPNPQVRTVALQGTYDIDLFEDEFGNPRSESNVEELLQSKVAGPARIAILQDTHLSGTEFMEYREFSNPTLSYGGLKHIVWDQCRQGDAPELASVWRSGSDGIFLEVKKHLESTLSSNFQITVDPLHTNQVHYLRWRKTSYSFGCSIFNMGVEVEAEDVSGRRSQPLHFYVDIPYGIPEIGTNQGRAQDITTRCRNEALDILSLQQYNLDLPFKKTGRCSSPHLGLTHSDNEVGSGIPCTSTYAVIERTWEFYSTASECLLSADAASVQHMQRITVGGLAVPSLPMSAEGLSDEYLLELKSNTSPTPSTPYIKESVVHHLTGNFDIFSLDEVIVAEDECGICSLEQTGGSLPFAEGEAMQVGEYSISVSASNDIGISHQETVLISIVQTLAVEGNPFQIPAEVGTSLIRATGDCWKQHHPRYVCTVISDSGFYGFRQHPLRLTGVNGCEVVASKVDRWAYIHNGNYLFKFRTNPSVDTSIVNGCFPQENAISVAYGPDMSHYEYPLTVSLVRTGSSCSWQGNDSRGCAEGYTWSSGDIPGLGSINGRGGGEEVDTTSDCANLCSSTAECKSYEWSPTSKKCNLNTVSKPTEPEPFQDYEFCTKAPHIMRWRCPVMATGMEVKSGSGGYVRLEGDGCGLMVQVIHWAWGQTGLYFRHDYNSLAPVNSCLPPDSHLKAYHAPESNPIPNGISLLRSSGGCVWNGGYQRWRCPLVTTAMEVKSGSGGGMVRLEGKGCSLQVKVIHWAWKQTDLYFRHSEQGDAPVNVCLPPNVQVIATPLHDCDLCHAERGVCVESTDGVECVCRNGYVGDGYTCDDYDECAEALHKCLNTADCVNTIGGYTCECRQGYVGDGFNDCLRANLLSGDSCEWDEQCWSGDCQHSACAQGTLPLDASCEDNAQCASDACSSGSCVCQENQDCPASENFCSEGQCMRHDLPEGSDCFDSGQCETNLCLQGGCKRDDLPLDSGCFDSRQCKTNYCLQGKCSCSRSSQCPTAKPVCISNKCILILA